MTSSTESGSPVRRITLVISSLDSGGAERVLSTLANVWADRRRDVTLVTLARTGTDFYTTGPGVRRIGLDLLRESGSAPEALVANVRRVRAIRRAVLESRPDVVLSFMDTTNVLVLLALAWTSVPVVVSERVEPTQQRPPRPWGALRRLTYPRAARVVMQTERAAAWARGFLPDASVAVVPNPVWVPAADTAGDGNPRANGSGSDGGLVVAMGRLAPQKGFDVLIRAFAGIASAHPGWTLEILGEGGERARLEGLVQELDLTHAIRLPGRVAHPEERLRAADLFVLSSRYEGFPNALLEAMACGLPVVATDCPSGPAEIVRPGRDGLLVPPDDPDALGSAIHELVVDPGARRRLSAGAREIRQRFSLDRVVAEWDAVLSAAALDSRGAA